MKHKKEKSDSGSRKRYSIEVKKDIAKHGIGIRVSDMVKEYNIANQTIIKSTIIKNKWAFKGCRSA